MCARPGSPPAPVLGGPAERPRSASHSRPTAPVAPPPATRATQALGRPRPNGAGPASPTAARGGPTVRQPRPAAPPRGNGAAPERDWDLALARLIPLPTLVSRITVVVHGVERLLFDRAPSPG